MRFGVAGVMFGWAALPLLALILPLTAVASLGFALYHGFMPERARDAIADGVKDVRKRRQLRKRLKASADERTRALAARGDLSIAPTSRGELSKVD